MNNGENRHNLEFAEVMDRLLDQIVAECRQTISYEAAMRSWQIRRRNERLPITAGRLLPRKPPMLLVEMPEENNGSSNSGGGGGRCCFICVMGD